MTMTSPTPPLDPAGARGLPQLPDLAEAAAARWVQKKLAEQPWYKRKANTITTLGGALATVLTFTLTSATGLPPWAVYTISSVLLVLTVLGVNVTPNGTTPATARDVQAAVTDPVVLNTLAAQVLQTVGSDIDLEARLRSAIPDTVAEHLGRHRRGD